MSNCYEAYPIILEEVPFSLEMKEGQVLSGTHAHFSFPNGFPVDRNSASALASGLDVAVNKILTRQIDNNPDNRERLEKVMAWIDKKAKFHPWQMRREIKKISDMPEFYQELLDLGYRREQLREDLETIAILHDIGRLAEVDLKNIIKFDLKKVKGFDHAFESVEILEAAGFARPEILLPIKYHGMLNFEQEMQKDPLFLSLNETEKKRVWSYSRASQDADRMSNMMSYAVYGCKKSAEMYDPNYSPEIHPEKYYAVTPICVERCQKGEQGRVSESKTYLDCLLRWIGWASLMHYDGVREQAADRIVERMWDRTFEQAEEDFQKDPNKNPQRYAATLKTLNETKMIVMSRLKPGYQPDQEKQDGLKYRIRSLLFPQVSLYLNKSSNR